MRHESMFLLLVCLFVPQQSPNRDVLLNQTLAKCSDLIWNLRIISIVFQIQLMTTSHDHILIFSQLHNHEFLLMT